MNNTVTLYKCDDCGNLIRAPELGRVVHGNLCMADPINYAGLIGSNFPQDNPPGTTPKKFTEEDIKKTVLCTPCFMKVVMPEVTVTTTRHDKF